MTTLSANQSFVSVVRGLNGNVTVEIDPSKHGGLLLHLEAYRHPDGADEGSFVRLEVALAPPQAVMVARLLASAAEKMEATP